MDFVHAIFQSMDKVYRVSAKALIVHEDQLLCIRKQSPSGDYFVVPGGGQEHGETLLETVKREVFEETGFRVQVSDLIFVREYIGANHEFANTSSHAHQVEFFFKASLIGKKIPPLAKPTVPDPGQIAIEWLCVSKIASAPLYPKSLRIEMATRISPQVYRGDVN